MGACGGLASAIFAQQSSFDSNYTSIKNINYMVPAYWNQFIGVGISAGMGIGGGLILAPLICLVNA